MQKWASGGIKHRKLHLSAAFLVIALFYDDALLSSAIICYLFIPCLLICPWLLCLLCVDCKMPKQPLVFFSSTIVKVAPNKNCSPPLSLKIWSPLALSLELQPVQPLCPYRWAQRRKRADGFLVHFWSSPMKSLHIQKSAAIFFFPTRSVGLMHY